MNNNSPFPSGSHLAAYVRDSGGETQELSTSQQETVIRDWAMDHGQILTILFKDEATPGSSVVGRDGFQDMMHYFRTGATEAGIIIWNFQRFSRDIDDSQFFRADLRRRGYAVHSLDDDIPDGPMGRLFEAVIDWKNEQFLLDLSKDVKRGLHSLVKTHGALSGTPPRGFKREPLRIGKRRDGSDHIVHRWVPDPEWIDVIRLAFKMRAMGKTYRQIHAATGIYDSMNSYATFFSNKLYVGELIFGDLVIPDYCEPIVDRTTWNRVQEIHQKHHKLNNPNHPRRRTSKFILSGLINCALCGAPMNGHVINNTTRAAQADYVWTYYRCSRRTRRKDCIAPNIPQAAIEDAVIQEIKTHIITPDNLARVQEEAQKIWRESHDIKDKERARIDRQVAQLSKKLTNISNAIADSGGSRTLLDELLVLERRQAGFFSQLARLDEDPGPILDLDHNEVSARLSRALDLEYDGSNRQQIKDLLRNLIQRIDVVRERKKIKGMIYYYSPERAYEVCPHGDDIPHKGTNSDLIIIYF